MSVFVNVHAHKHVLQLTDVTHSSKVGANTQWKGVTHVEFWEPSGQG